MTDDPSGRRIGAPAVGAMNPAQRAAYDRIANSPYGPHGPRMVLLHDARLTDGWAALGAALAAADLPALWRETAVLIVAAAWQAAFQWVAHVEAARKAGLDEGSIEAIRLGGLPVDGAPADLAAARYAHALTHRRRVDDDDYQAARAAMGDTALVQFTAFVGHYANVAMTLVAHQVPLRDGDTSPFPAVG